MSAPEADRPARATADRTAPKRWTRELFTYLELLAVSGVLFGLPTFRALSRNTGAVIVARGATPLQIVTAVVIIVIGPAVVLWLIELLVGIRSAAARRVVHAFLLGAMTATFAFVVIHQWTDLADWLSLPLAAVPGIWLGVVVLRSEVTQRCLRFLSIAPLVLAGLFLFGPVVGPMLTRDQAVVATGVTVRKPQRVMMIVLDELPVRSLMDGSGRIDARLFPNFAALAGTGTWYRNATTVAPYTSVAVPAIATGRYPTDPGALPISEEYPQNIFTLLGDEFRFNVHETHNESLCPRALCPSGKGSPVKGLLEDAADAWEAEAIGEPPNPGCKRLCDDSPAIDGVPVAERFLASLHRSTGPQLDYVHAILPHAPWHLMGSGQDYAPTARAPFGLTASTEWSSSPAAQVEHQRHRLQVQYVDRWLGQVIARLKSIGEYDTTSIVVTADHGVAFEVSAPYRVPEQKTYQDIVWVPLIVKQAGQTVGQVDDRHASAIDVMPTVADLVGATVPWPVDGRSVLGTARADQDPRVLAWPSRSPYEPPDEADYIRWDGSRGFPRVLATPAVNPGVAGDLAFFGIGPFGNLIGRDPKPLVDRSATGPAVYLPFPNFLYPVDPTAAIIAWAGTTVAVAGPPNQIGAIAVNGRIAAVGPTQEGYGGNALLRLVLPPELYKPSRNRINIYQVTGTPAAPRLILLR